MVLGQVLQPGEIVEDDLTVAEGHEALLAQLAQHAVEVDGGKPQRVGQQVLVQGAGKTGLAAQAYQPQPQGR